MNRTTKWFGLVFGLMQLSAVEAAHADVVTFGSADIPVGKSPIQIEGVLFSTTLDGFHAVLDLAGVGASNGTRSLHYFADQLQYETFSLASDLPFNLTSIALGGSQNFGGSSQLLTITGYRSDSSTVTDQLTILPASFQTYALSDWTNLQSVRLGSLSRGYVAVDNIVLTAVPEPETYAMLLAGLCLTAVIARRRKAL